MPLTKTQLELVENAINSSDIIKLAEELCLKKEYTDARKVYEKAIEIADGYDNAEIAFSIIELNHLNDKDWAVNLLEKAELEFDIRDDDWGVSLRTLADKASKFDSLKEYAQKLYNELDEYAFELYEMIPVDIEFLLYEIKKRGVSKKWQSKIIKKVEEYIDTHEDISKLVALMNDK
jgi:hypothetical protein